MIKIEHVRTVELSADTIWAEMRHFDRVLRWIPRGDESEIRVEGAGVGAVRDIQLATMGYVQHTLIAFDDQERMFSYRLTGGMPLGMQEYRVVARVEPIDGGSRISWLGEMTADGSLNEAEVGRGLETALANMTTGIIAQIRGEEPAFVLQPGVDD